MYDELELIPERNVFDRIGGSLGGMANLRKSGYTNEEKFVTIAKATLAIVNQLDVDKIKQINLDVVDRLIRKIPDMQYKNPSAFVLGYLVAINSDYLSLEIDVDRLESVFGVNELIEESLFTKIEKEDIVRYTRMCLINKIK